MEGLECWLEELREGSPAGLPSGFHGPGAQAPALHPADVKTGAGLIVYVRSGTTTWATCKGKVRMECAAAIHFMWNRGWERVIDACLQHPSVRQHQVGGKSWESVCNTWWEKFASMCAFAWFSGADLGRLRNHNIAMATAHNELKWGKLLWTHLWIDHMYYLAEKWRILSKFSCFAIPMVHASIPNLVLA